MTDSAPSPVTIVLGGTGSVGQVLTKRLAEAGHHVVVAGRNPEKLDQLRSEGRFEVCDDDAAQPGTIEACIQQVKERHGSVTGIANCIGSILLKPAHLTTNEEFAGVLQTNLHSSFETIRGAAKSMRQSGGAVVLVSSAATSIGLANHEAIAAAKAGVEGLARSAAATYAASGVRVNVVSPGLVKSEMSRNIWENKVAAATSREMHPLGRLGEPDDIASLIEWLLSPRNDWITGQIIGLDGGLSSLAQRQRRSVQRR